MRKNVKCLLALGLVFALLLCGCSQNSGVSRSPCSPGRVPWD